MKLNFLILSTLILFATAINAQNTVGLLSYNVNRSLDGLNLIYPNGQPNAYLLNNCGEIVHTWPGDAGTVPGNSAYILDDGRLVKTVRPASVAGSTIFAPGAGASVEIRDWDNNLEWSFTLNNDEARLHHDITILNKNNRLTILMIAWERKTAEEAIQAGRDPNVLEIDEFWPDFLLEIDPETDEIVWEWHAWDHLVQDFDSTKDNFGDVGNSPGKLDINLDLDGTGDPDWMHCNAVDYDPVNDNILLGTPYFDEIYIIDHSTTTEQAAGDTGGFSNRGGDFMFRWGRPTNYRQGDDGDQTLFFQHDPAFIDDFVDFFDPNFGKISVFNNQVGPNFSAGNIISPQFDMYTFEYAFANDRFLPEEVQTTVTHPVDPSLLFSTGLSSFQYLRNGNYLITSGRMGYAVEITPDNEVVWEYITPLNGGNPATQGDVLGLNDNLTFRMFRYDPEYSAFDGRDLTSKGFIELEPNIGFCDELTDVEDLSLNYGLEIYPNPASDMITVEWDNSKFVDIEIYDFMGRPIVNEARLSGGRRYFDTSEWNNGIYIIQVNNKEAGRFIIVN